MTVREAAELVRDVLTREGVGPETRPLLAFVRKALGAAANQAVAEYVADPRRPSLQLPGSLRKPHEVEVQYDERRKEHYFQMPKGVPILDGDQAIQINAVANPDYEVSILRPGDASRIDDLRLYGAPFARVEGTRVSLMFFDATAEHLLVHMVTFAGDLGWDDDLPVPAEVEMRVIGIVADWFSGKRQAPPDVRVDNSSVA